MEAKLVLHQKRVLKNSMVIELKIWNVKETKDYPDGLRYMLIAVRPDLKKKVLIDNHSPKGHHYHLDEAEFEYQFRNIDKLICDFRNLVKIHFGVNI